MCARFRLDVGQRAFLCAKLHDRFMQFSLSSARLRALFHCFIWCSMLAINAAHAAPPRIIIAYPPDKKIVAFDHVLLSGSVAKGATLKIDNRVLDIAPDGLFIEWWPLKPGENMIVLESALGGETTKRELRVNSEMPRPPRLTFPINRDDATPVSDMTFYVASSLWNQSVNVSFRTMSG